MNEVFRQHVEQLHPKYDELMRMEPVTQANLHKTYGGKLTLLDEAAQAVAHATR